MKHFSSTFTWDWQNLPYVATRVTRGQRISEKSGQTARGCVPIAQACALPIDCAISSHVQSAATGDVRYDVGCVNRERTIRCVELRKYSLSNVSRAAVAPALSPAFSAASTPSHLHHSSMREH